jgi:hypothetical protein
MKKKLFLVFSLFLCIFLASCRGDNQVVKLTDNADTTVAEQLNLSVLDNAESINKDLDKTDKNYVDVKFPTDLNKSLVVRNINLDTAFTSNRVKTVNASALTFVTGISAEYQQAIMSEIYNDEYGLTAEKLGLSVDILNGTSFSVKISKNESDKGINYYKEGKTNITLSVIYLPVRVVVVNDKVTVADITVLVPVYAEINLGEASDVFKPYKVVSITLEEDGSLPNKKD